MLISSIVVIVLRLFSIQWLIQGLGMLISILTPPHRNFGRPDFSLAPAILMLVFSVVAWFAAPVLGRLIAGRKDALVSVPVPPLRDLYAFAFILIGLYFVMMSLGEVLVWLQYEMFLPVPANAIFLERDKFVRSLITLLAGLASVIFGRKWAGKLCEGKTEAAGSE